MYDRFIELGYVIIKNVLKPEDAARMAASLREDSWKQAPLTKSERQKRGWEPIFGYNQGEAPPGDEALGSKARKAGTTAKKPYTNTRAIEVGLTEAAATSTKPAATTTKPAATGAATNTGEAVKKKRKKSRLTLQSKKSKKVEVPADMDPNRLQRPAPEIGAEVAVHLRRYWESFFPFSDANDWVALRSIPGGQKQPPHTDFLFPREYKHLDHVCMSAGVIVALEPGTHMYVYGWNRLCVNMKEEVRVPIGVGEALIFRGDLIHAGGAYDTDNIRLHAYLDVIGVEREFNWTAITPVLTFDQGDLTVCPLHNCAQTGTPDSIKEHITRYHHAYFNIKHRQHGA